MKNHGMHITTIALPPNLHSSLSPFVCLVSYMLLFSVLSYVLFVISVCVGMYVCVRVLCSVLFPFPERLFSGNVNGCDSAWPIGIFSTTTTTTLAR